MAKKAAAKAKKTTTKKSAKPVRAPKKPAKAKPARSTKPVAKKPAKAVKAKGKPKLAPAQKPKAAKSKAPIAKKPAAKPVKAALPKAKAAQLVKKAPPIAVVKREAKAATPAPKVEAVKPVADKVVPSPVPVRPMVVKKKPLKERYSIEFLVHSTPSALYEMLLSPSGFSEWYCDDVDVRGEEYTFKWGNEEEVAMIIGQRQNEVTRFHRVDDDDPDSYFEFRIKIDPITDEVALIVTDHAWPNEMENSKALWASQIANLTRVLGA